MENKELTHHGIIGMRWGVRRYQNKDGTLTAKGKKRYSADMEKLKKEEAILKNKQRTQAKIDKLLKKNQEVDELKKQLSGKANNKPVETKTSEVSNKPKSIKDMTDEELASRINRMRLEQTYKSMLPKEASAGEKFINKYLKPAGEKAANKLGDTILDKVNKTIRDKFGLDVDEKSMKKLKEEAEKAGYEMKIRANEKDKKKYNDSSSESKKSNSSETSTSEVNKSGGYPKKTYRFRKKSNTEFADTTINEVPNEVKDIGEKYIQLSLFDDLDE